MTQNNDTINKHNSSKILGIQFSILSPEEIRNGSVCQITSRDTYINNKPVIKPDRCPSQEIPFSMGIAYQIMLP